MGRRGPQQQVSRQQIKPGTFRRVLPYAGRYRWSLLSLLAATALDAVITVSTPLILARIIDDGIIPRRLTVVIVLAAAVAVLALIDSAVIYVQGWVSARIGQGVIYDLRTKTFGHVQQQPLAFFTRSQTGSLVSRLNTDVIGAQQALTTLLVQATSTLLTLALTLGAMFYLSWQIALMAILLVPFFIFPGKLLGRRMQRLTRENMQLNAEMGSLMNERFNVAGALLVKLYGRLPEELALFSSRAGRVRDIAVRTAVFGRVLFIVVNLISALTISLAFGVGGILVIHGAFQVGSLVALITLLDRLYGPINQLANLQVNALTALVSFDRVFEVLDLRPAITERPTAVALPAAGTAPDIEFDRVSFRYPLASEMSLASLESIALPAPEQASDAWVLSEMSFRAPAGQLTALVGPSGAGKTTITHLVSRLYDPGPGTIRIGGTDIRDLTLQSLHDTVGVVTQDAHLFHDTIRANLLYARPDATEPELIECCRSARIGELISALPDGLDTVVGDRGYRLSGGEKQRLAIARLLLKAPAIVVLDEATAHLDSESEAAVQRALKTALTGRTSLVIAHRLSTIREADQILVVDAGQIRERGSHETLLAAGGLYAELYHTQFASQANADHAEPAVNPVGTAPRMAR